MKDNLTGAKKALTKAVTNLDTAMNQEVLPDEKNREWRKECETTMNFLSDLPVRKAHDDVRNLRMNDSRNWIVEKETFLKWVNCELKTIWCPGKRTYSY